MMFKILLVLTALASAAASARYSKFDVKKGTPAAKTVDGAVVGAKVKI